jgi:hypothetical protein
MSPREAHLNQLSRQEARLEKQARKDARRALRLAKRHIDVDPGEKSHE